jgi:hypothetical protein
LYFSYCKESEDDLSETVVLYHDTKKNTYRYEQEVTQEKVDGIRNTKFLVEKDRPLKTIGNYKKEDLLDIAHKIQLTNVEQFAKKQDLYDAIQGVLQ